MKKVSLLTVMALTMISSMASAQMSYGNMMDTVHPALNNLENPLYKPAEGNFYSKTNFNFTPISDYDTTFQITEEFGYGLSQDWAISASLGYSWMDKATNWSGESSSLSDFTLAALYRPIANKDLVWDVTGGVKIDTSNDIMAQYSLAYPIDDLGKRDTAVFVDTKLGLNLAHNFIMAVNTGFSMATDDKRDLSANQLGDTSYWNMGAEGQVAFSDDWSMNLGYNFKKFVNKDGFDKAMLQNIVASANWQADMALLSLYVDYDITGKNDRTQVYSSNYVGSDGDDNRWSMGARVGVEF